MKNLNVFVLVVLILSACIRSIEISLEVEDPQLVLNSILDPSKDTIRVSLSWSHSVTSTQNFQHVNNALVELYENQELIGQFAFIDSGLYVLNYHSRAGKEYEIVARIDEKIAKGRTIVPKAIPFELEKIDEEYDEFKIILNRKDVENSNVWINVLSTHRFVSDTLEKVPRNHIYSNSINVDPFNRSLDTYKQYAYNYWYYLLLTSNNSQDAVAISFGLQGNDARSNEIIVSAFDDNLTNYIKSSIIASNVEQTKGDYPFYLDPAVVYSNVEGGIGIVGSLNSSSQEYFKRLASH